MEDNTKPLDMRYDGAPIRSKKPKKNWLDHIWSFFASVKVGVALIVLTLLGAVIGSIYPQEEAFITPPGLEYYESNFGWLGKWYYLLGFSRTYTSWWFQLLVILLGTSLVIASLDRGIPLYKALKKQSPERTVDFMLRQKLSLQHELPFDAQDEAAASQWLESIGNQLKKQRFRVFRAGNALLGEKNRWARSGPYVTHVGLVLFLLIILIRTLPGFTLEEYLPVLEGDTVPIASTKYYVKNVDFTVEFYETDELRGHYREEERILPKRFVTDIILYECTDRCGTSDPVLVEVARGPVEVNKPLQYRGLSIYQFGYEATPQIRSVTVSLKDKQTGENYGEFTLKTTNPDLSYEAGPYKLRLFNYYPEFTVGAGGEPATTSGTKPNAPGYIFIITGPDLPEDGVRYMYFPREVDKERFRQDEINLALGSGNKFEITAESMENVEIAAYTSTLAARKDRIVPFLLIAGIITVIGTAMGFYWHHRRIWVRVDGNLLTLGAYTNKNWYGMQTETQKMLKACGLEGAAAKATYHAKERDSS